MVLQDLLHAVEEGGWRINGYEEWQRSRADIEAEREAARERARKSRERAAHARGSSAGVTQPEVEVDAEEIPPNPQGFAEQDDPERLRALTVERATEARDALLNGQASKLAAS